MVLTGTQAHAELALRIAGVSMGAAAVPVLRRRRAGEGYGADGACAGTVIAIDSAVTVRFQPRDRMNVDFIELDVPAVAGIYRIKGFRVDGIEVSDLARRVIAVHDRLLEPADTSLLRFGADAARPRLEVDVRGLNAADGDGDAGVIEVAIAREYGTLELRTVVQQNAESLAQLIRRQSSEHSETALALAEELRRQGARLADHGERLRSLAEGQSEQGAALGELRQQMLHIAGQVQATDQARQAQDEAVVARLLSALDAAREQHVLAMQQAETLQAQIRHLQWSFENVFWRRWLRRLRIGRA